MSLPATFPSDLAHVALDQHAKFSGLDESSPKLCAQIKRFWDDLGFAFTSCTAVPWSAVFVSWCVQRAGASASEFVFNPQHSVFVHAAIKNKLRGTGKFQAFKIADHAPKIGDIIQNNRGGTDHDYDFASKNTHYSSHSAIVVEVGVDTDGNHFARTIGGNEGDSIRSKIVHLTPTGFIEQRAANPYICVITTI